MSNYYNRMTELACWVASINVGEYDKDDIQQMVNAVGKEVSRDFYIKYGQKYGANVRNILTYIEEAQDGYWDAEGFEAETFEAMIEMITEKEMMQRINHVKEQLILTQGEGDMRFQEFRKWVRNQISEWYDNNEDYKKEMEEAVERLNERFGAEGTDIMMGVRLNVGEGFYDYDQVYDFCNEYLRGKKEEDGKTLWVEKFFKLDDYNAEGFDADAPKLLAKSRVLDKIIAWHERNQLQGESIQYELDRINWMLENLDKDYDEYPYTYDGGFREGFDAETFNAERYKPTSKEIRFLVRNLRAVWIKYERGIYDEDEVLNKTERILYHTGVMQEEYGAEEFEAETISDNVAGIEIIVDDANMKHLPSIKASIAYNMQNPIGQWKCWGCGENYETSKKPKLIVMTKDKQGAFCGCGKRAETFGADEMNAEDSNYSFEPYTHHGVFAHDTDDCRGTLRFEEESRIGVCEDCGEKVRISKKDYDWWMNEWFGDYEAEGFEAQGYDEIEVEKYVEIDWETDPHPHPYDDDINNSEIFNEVSGYVEDAVERRGRDSGNGNIDVEIEVEDKEENEVVEKTVRVEYDYHLQGESFEATKNCVWCGSTENICCTNEASQNSVKGIKNRFGEEVIESFPMSNPIEEEYVCDECCFICGDKSVLIPNLIESSEMGHPESFEATKGIDTYSQPFEELRIKTSKAKVGILLASIVASGVWFVNKMKED